MNKDSKRKVDRDYYHKNKDIIKPKKLEQQKQRRIRNRKFVIDYLSNNPCIDCGENDFIVLEFDHINQSTKRNTVSNMVDLSLKTIKEEIEKCEVRCANCHRRKTAKQLGWYKNV